MPGDSEHPVTVLGDLMVVDNLWDDPRPATVADLVSALRAEGCLVVEKVDGEWDRESLKTLERGWLKRLNASTSTVKLRLRDALDALAEAQPFPPAGG